MTGRDLTVALTAHDETLVAGPALRGAEIACRAVEAQGLSVQRLVGLSSPTARSREYFRQPDLAAWTVFEYELDDEASTRNALVGESAGKWIAFLGCEHIPSENWLVAAVEVLRSCERAIVHPEVRWVFDRQAAVYAVPPQEDPLFAPQAFYLGSQYGSVSVAPREVHGEVPYAATDREARVSHHDWQFNVETMARGWQHTVAPDTIVFERQREVAAAPPPGQQFLVRSLEPLAIDRVAALGRESRSE